MGVFRDLKNRVLQLVARLAPGATTLRVRCHRWRGVKIGQDVFIGSDVMIETSYPHLVSIGNDISIGLRTTIIGHFRSSEEEKRKIANPDHVTVRIKDHVYLGPGSIIMPNVTIGEGAVVAAGSVINRSVEPMTMVRGNPAIVVGRCGVPLGAKTPKIEFFKKFKRVNPVRDK